MLNALNTLIAPRAAPMCPRRRCLTSTQWPSNDLATAVNTASQYFADLSDTDLDDFLRLLRRAREGGVAIPELSNEMADAD